MRIMGIDPSMDSSGICVMDLDDKYEISNIMFYGYNKVRKWCIETDKVNIHCLGTQYTKKSIYERIDIALSVFETAIGDGIDYMAIEDFSYGSGMTNSTYQIGEFVGSIRKRFYDHGIKMDRYSPTSIKRFATGSPNAGKYMMMLAFKREYPEVFPIEIEEDLKLDAAPQTDLNDAFWICEILRNKLKMLNDVEVDPKIKTSLEYSSTKKSHSLLDIIHE